MARPITLRLCWCFWRSLSSPCRCFALSVIHACRQADPASDGLEAASIAEPADVPVNELKPVSDSIREPTLDRVGQPMTIAEAEPPLRETESAIAIPHEAKPADNPDELKPLSATPAKRETITTKKSSHTRRPNRRSSQSGGLHLVRPGAGRLAPPVDSRMLRVRVSPPMPHRCALSLLHEPSGSVTFERPAASVLHSQSMQPAAWRRSPSDRPAVQSTERFARLFKASIFRRYRPAGFRDRSRSPSVKKTNTRALGLPVSIPLSLPDWLSLPVTGIAISHAHATNVLPSRCASMTSKLESGHGRAETKVSKDEALYQDEPRSGEKMQRLCALALAIERCVERNEHFAAAARGDRGFHPGRRCAREWRCCRESCRR